MKGLKLVITNLNYTTHDEFDSGDPSSMQDSCHI